MLNDLIEWGVQVVRGVVMIVLFCAGAWGFVYVVKWLAGG